jgi:hypothetical protein
MPPEKANGMGETNVFPAKFATAEKEPTGSPLQGYIAVSQGDRIAAAAGRDGGNGPATHQRCGFATQYGGGGRNADAQARVGFRAGHEGFADCIDAGDDGVRRAGQAQGVRSAFDRSQISRDREVYGLRSQAARSPQAQARYNDQSHKNRRLFFHDPPKFSCRAFESP